MIKHSIKSDPYQLHRLALASLLTSASDEDIAKTCKRIAETGEEVFAGFLVQQGLAPLWDKLLESRESTPYISEQFKSTLHKIRLQAAGSYLLQHHNLALVKTIMEEANIAHVIYKGADTREHLYEEPALRPAVDIDILIPEQHKIAAIKAFKKYGFMLYAQADNISHEANLIKGNTSIDLHWDILRPGRTRVPMANSLLLSRMDHGHYWGMGDEATLFVLLVHPVFAKYSTAPQASLIRIVDLSVLLAKNNLDWQEVIKLLDQAGLKTAAWITIQWYVLLTHCQPPPQLMSAIKPGKVRQKYLNYWLKKNLSSKLIETPTYIQLGFTLPAHDQWRDAIRAVTSARKLKNQQKTDLNALLRQTSEGV